MTNQEAAQTILRQLGGNRFIAMTGAREFLAGDSQFGLTFRIGRALHGINTVSIRVNANDLYDIEYVALRGTKIKVVATSENVYCDALQADFTKHTGLRTSL